MTGNVVRKAKENSPCLVLGCHKLGLGVIRALGEKGVPVVAVHYHPRDMGQVSKYVVRRYRAPHPDENEEAFVDFLLGLKREWRNSVLLPSDDATLIPISKQRGALQQHFRVVANDWCVTEKYIVKKHTYAIAERNGIPCPHTLVPSSYSEATRFAERIGFPCLLKPCIGHRFFQLFRRKAIVISHQADLKEAYQKAQAARLEMMVQELIPGDDTHGANYNSFCINGHTFCAFTADKLRLSPPGLGTPRVVVSRSIPEICESGRKILKAIDYAGFSCVEFKRDARDDVYKLMEVNGRQNLSSLLAVRCGMNFPYMVYRHALDGSVPTCKVGFRERLFWIDLERDLIQSLLSYRQERLPWREFLRPYLNEHVFAVWSLRDLAPFLKRLTDVIIAGPPFSLQAIWNKRPSSVL